jgi:hypothetical protein
MASFRSRGKISILGNPHPTACLCHQFRRRNLLFLHMYIPSNSTLHHGTVPVYLWYKDLHSIYGVDWSGQPLPNETGGVVLERAAARYFLEKVVHV